MEVTHKQLNKLIKVYYETKTPLFLWGTMGIGKSSLLKETAKEISNSLKLGFVEGEPDGEDSFGFVDIRVSQLEPSDLRGLPRITEKGTNWVLPDWLPKNEKSKGIIFFDELNLSPPSIQASCYQLILDRRLGSYTLPSGWVIFSAGNTTSDKANVFDLPSPLANRFTHLTLNIPSVKNWSEWGLKNNIDSSILAFLEFKPQYLYNFEKNKSDKSFATPRSWEFCNRLIKNSKLSEEEKQILISSAVGEGIGIEFTSFLRLKTKINLNDILNNPEIVEEITELDLKYSLLSVITERYREDSKILEKCFKICEYLDAEFSILLLRYLSAVNQREFRNSCLKSKLFKDSISKKYGKYLFDYEE
jgi:MoxR-like ATPase